MRTYHASDGVAWTVQVAVPGSSNAMVIFRHPAPSSSHLDRYNWYLSDGPEARSVTSRLKPDDVLDRLDDTTLARLFRRSMPVSKTPVPAARTLGL